MILPVPDTARRCARPAASTQGPHRPRFHRRSAGVALVITLILLAVITTLAIAFLALTYRETASVDALGRTTDSELAAESALERARAQILNPFPVKNSRSNDYGREVMGPDLMVSVNWHTNRIEVGRLTNDPSPPVFVRTNTAVDDRFFLDLNRNGQFEETGYVPVLDDNFQRVGLETNWVVGDPQWIGVLQDPSLPHSPSNRFIARYAFLIQPAGRSLDVNWIHNQARNPNANLRTGNLGYFRNQGVGTWELNLAAFLTDLNPNYWGGNLAPGGPYTFEPFQVQSPGVATAQGGAFFDAREFLDYRYLSSAANLFPARHWFVNPVFPNIPALVFPTNSVDDYSNGPVPTNTASFPLFISEAGQFEDVPAVAEGWPGADQGKKYYTPHDYFDPGKLWNPNGFRRQLNDASARGSSSNRYTFYRMLAQLATDSAPEREDKINLNYVNVGGSSASEMISWTNQFNPKEPANTLFKDQMGRDVTGPELFFNTTASILLSNEFSRVNGTNTGLVDLWKFAVYTNDGTRGIFLYTPRMHQLLQVTANVYESMVARKVGGNTGDENYPYYSTVFRPTFRRAPGGNAIYFDGYVDETRNNNFRQRVMNGTYRWSSFTNAPSSLDVNDNFYDVPILFGARKGIPNFNEFNVQSYVHFNRKLQFTKDTSGRLDRIEQQFIFAVSNVFFAESWNSLATNAYTGATAYPRNLQLLVTNLMTTTLTNTDGFIVPVRFTNSGFFTNFTAGSWTNGQFKLSDLRGVVTAEDSILTASGAIPNQGLNTNKFEPIQPRGTNSWGLHVENRLGYFLFDNGHLVDAFTSARMNMDFDISKEMQQGRTGGTTPLWDYVNRPGSFGWPAVARTLPSGIYQQIMVSLNSGTSPEWTDYAASDYKALDVQAFRSFFNDTNASRLVMQAPFNPVARKLRVGTWQVNDPLVHYNEHDLYKEIETGSLQRSGNFYDPLKPVGTSPSLGAANNKYNPWGGRNGTTPAEKVPSLKDPGITNSAAWDFPSDSAPQFFPYECVAQKLPNIGWLGRIHRGTPWQTIYLKAEKAADADWKKTAGPGFTDRAALETAPVQDRRLFDLFTTAPHPNATRGRLSINQTNLAAWSAVLSGVTVPRVERQGSGFEKRMEAIQPVSISGGLNSPLMQIFEAINDRRGTNQFTRLGDLLSVEELTDKSPFIPFSANEKQDPRFPATDADYEAIPQQILSLVQVGEPRFVVYSWGQSLKPARFGVEESGQNLALRGPSIMTADDPTDPISRPKGICINYQITGETATRAVIRVDFERDPVNGLKDYRKPHAVVESFNVIPVE